MAYPLVEDRPDQFVFYFLVSRNFAEFHSRQIVQNPWPAGKVMIVFANLPDFIGFLFFCKGEVQPPTGNRYCHCQNISGIEKRSGGQAVNFMQGTRHTDRTRYFRVLLFLPVKLIVDSISTNLKRIRGIIVVLLLNRLWG